jgi:hypothetical protein
MESVYVFGWVYGQQDFLRIHLRRQGKLDEDAVDFLAAIEIVDEGQQLFGSDGVGGAVLLTIETDFLRAFDFAADVDLGGGVVSDQDYGEAGPDANCDQGLYFGGNFGSDVGSDFCTI